MNYLAVLVGGGIGSLLRYLLALFSYRLFSPVFPWGTLSVNLIGSFLIGLMWGFSEHYMVSPNVKLFILVGLLGGFTTFSSFALESFNLFRDGEIKLALFNILAQNLSGIALVLAGFILSGYMIRIMGRS